jgi:hypothetical protein
VLGISPDSAEWHVRFKVKYGLPFALLADEGKAVLKAYGAFGKKLMYGKEVEGVIRSTCIVGPDGIVRKVFPKVKPEGHADEVLAALKRLGRGRDAPMGDGNDRGRAYFCLVLTMSTWGSLYVVTRIVLRTIPPISLLLFRHVIAFAALYGILAARMRRGIPCEAIEVGDRKYFALVGLIWYFLGVGAQTLGTKYAGASVVSGAYVILGGSGSGGNTTPWSSRLGPSVSPGSARSFIPSSPSSP